jgi:hypothetical protein
MVPQTEKREAPFIVFQRKRESSNSNHLAGFPLARE